jgi:hypothetical protein
MIGVIMILKKNVSDKEIVDTGMAVALMLLIVGLVTQDLSFMMYAAISLIINMTFFGFFSNVARLWLNLSHYFGLVMSTFLLSLIYFVLIVPIGLFRSFLGHDPMRLREWKSGNDSLFIERNFSYDVEDLKYPY